MLLTHGDSARPVGERIGNHDHGACPLAVLSSHQTRPTREGDRRLPCARGCKDDGFPGTLTNGVGDFHVDRVAPAADTNDLEACSGGESLGLGREIQALASAGAAGRSRADRSPKCARAIEAHRQAGLARCGGRYGRYLLDPLGSSG